MKKKPALKVKASVSSASCSIYSSLPMVCPLCRIEIPAKTAHTCGGASSAAGAVLAEALVKAFGGADR